MAAIDFHTHILPRIDDGSKNREMSIQMIADTANAGIAYVVATPHFYADQMRIHSFIERRDRAYRVIADDLDKAGIRMIPGAEVAYFSGMHRAEDLEKLCFGYGNTRIMMLEMPFRAWTANDLDEVEMLIRGGYHIMIAHLDRFYQFQTDKGMIPALMELPVTIQINAEALLNHKTRGQMLKLFKAGKAHVLGSDCHNITGRPQNIGVVRQIIAEKYGNEKLKQIDRYGLELFRKYKR